MGSIARLERAMLTSWPALSTAYDGDWVIRLAEGHTKRSNSVTCLGADDTDLDARINRVASIYRDRGLPAVFRVSPLAPPALDDRLDRLGWRRFDETIVMTLDLESSMAAGLADQDDVAVTSRPDDAWLEACHRIDGMGRKGGAIFERLLDVMIPPAGFARIMGTERVDALALMVIDHELAGLFEVMTAPERQRQGLARKLTGHLLAWSKARGARTGWLAVVADNRPAMRLYETLGFREVYRYHYRSNG